MFFYVQFGYIVDFEHNNLLSKWNFISFLLTRLWSLGPLLVYGVSNFVSRNTSAVSIPLTESDYFKTIYHFS